MQTLAALAIALSALLAAAAPVLAHVGDGTNTFAACQVAAPVQSACTTGSHVHSGTIGLGFGNGFVGQATNILEWDGGSASIHCILVGFPVPPFCGFVGTPPDAGVEFTHRCEVDGFAIGTLQCILTHD